MSPDNALNLQVTRADYDRLIRVNYSTLKAMAKSPAHYEHGLVVSKKDTDAMKAGRAVHVAVLEPDRFRSNVALWDGGVRRGKDWDAFRRNHEGQDILTESEHARCLAIQKAVRSDATARKFVSEGRGEVTMLWSTPTTHGASIECKGRIDFDAASAIVDLKTTRDASPDGFGRECWRYSYQVQAAWYSDAYERITGVRKPYYLVAVESEAPHVVQVYRVPDIALDLGRETYKPWLERLAICREESRWPGYADGDMDLSLPKWAVDFSEEDDITALDLAISQPEA